LLDGFESETAYRGILTLVDRSASQKDAGGWRSTNHEPRVGLELTTKVPAFNLKAWMNIK